MSNRRGRPRPSKAERKQRAIARKADEQRLKDLAWQKEKEKIQEETATNKEAEERSKAIRQYLAELIIEPQKGEIDRDGDSQPFLLWKLEEDTLLLHLLSFLQNPKDVISVSGVCRRLWKLSVDNLLWQPLALTRWPELQSASDVDDWKLLYLRKHREDTKYGDFMTSVEFAKCDWYACPNGHPYMIGECRKPMKMARCAVCKELIGGAQHKMLATNQRIGAVAPRTKKGKGKNTQQDSPLDSSQNVDTLAATRLGDIDIAATLKDQARTASVDTMEVPPQKQRPHGKGT